MKLAMKFDKSQLLGVYKWTQAGNYNMTRDVFLEAGYTKVNFLLVGGGGGAAGDSGSTSDRAQCGAGGGGGGMLRGRLWLVDLPTIVPFQVGGAGYDGVKGSNGVAGTNGTAGAHSIFAGYYAYGGGGGQGGIAAWMTGGKGADYTEPSIGGDGGGNSLGLGGGGVGGRNAYHFGFANQYRQAAVAPGYGSYQAHPTATGFAGARGGGGGIGMYRWGGATDTNAGPGGNGGMNEYGAAGGAPAGYQGGGGGGQNIVSFTGVPEVYGGPKQAGVVALVFE